jgi:hypothetical protein
MSAITPQASAPAKADETPIRHAMFEKGRSFVKSHA